MAWADHEAPLLLGLSASWLPWHRENGSGGPAAALLGKSPMHRVTVQEVLTLLPSSMLLLLQKEPWKEQTQKVRGGSHLFSRAGNLLSPAVAAVGWKWELNEDWLTPKAFILSPEHRSYAMSWRLRPAQVHGIYCLETALTAAAAHLW